MQGLGAEMVFSIRCLQRELFLPPCRSVMRAASTEQPPWPQEQGWDPKEVPLGQERMISVDPTCASALGPTGLISKAQKGLLVPDGPTNQLHQVMEADCLHGASLFSLMLLVGTSVSFPLQPCPDLPSYLMDESLSLLPCCRWQMESSSPTANSSQGRWKSCRSRKVVLLVSSWPSRTKILIHSSPQNLTD